MATCPRFLHVPSFTATSFPSCLKRAVLANSLARGPAGAQLASLDNRLCAWKGHWRPGSLRLSVRLGRTLAVLDLLGRSRSLPLEKWLNPPWSFLRRCRHLGVVAHRGPGTALATGHSSGSLTPSPEEEEGVGGSRRPLGTQSFRFSGHTHSVTPAGPSRKQGDCSKYLLGAGEVDGLICWAGSGTPEPYTSRQLPELAPRIHYGGKFSDLGTSQESGTAVQEVEACSSPAPPRTPSPLLQEPVSLWCREGTQQWQEG